MVNQAISQLRPPKLSKNASLPEILIQTFYVTQVSERSDTRVHGYGYKGTVSIGSSVSVVQKIWVRREDGSEDCLEFDQKNIKVRAGQLLKIAYLSKRGSNNYYRIALYCPTTGDYHCLKSDYPALQYPHHKRIATFSIIASILLFFSFPFWGKFLGFIPPLFYLIPGIPKDAASFLIFFSIMFLWVALLCIGIIPLIRISKWSARFSRYVEAELRR